MFDIQKTRRLCQISGLHSNGQVKKVSDIICVRKHMEKHHAEWNRFLRCPQNNMFAFVSSPQMPKQNSEIMSDIKVWCHPFQNRSTYLKNKNCLYEMMPESDFMDRFFVKQGTSSIKYDFFYMTLNGRCGVRYKGLHDFFKCLPILCGKMKLKGLIIVYFPAMPIVRKLSEITKDEKKMLKRHADNLTFLWGWQDQDKLADIMSSCKFGFYPNTVDCSPRIIPECILRDRPVLVNKNIWGGWHYVNNETGAFFDPAYPDSVASAADMLMTKKFSPSEHFMKHYGFVKSSERLARLLSSQFPQMQGFSHVYFAPYARTMRNIFKGLKND